MSSPTATCILRKEHFKSIFNREAAYAVRTDTASCKSFKKRKQRFKFEKIKAECTECTENGVLRRNRNVKIKKYTEGGEGKLMKEIQWGKVKMCE